MQLGKQILNVGDEMKGANMEMKPGRRGDCMRAITEPGFLRVGPNRMPVSDSIELRGLSPVSTEVKRSVPSSS